MALINEQTRCETTMKVSPEPSNSSSSSNNLGFKVLAVVVAAIHLVHFSWSPLRLALLLLSSLCAAACRRVYVYLFHPYGSIFRSFINPSLIQMLTSETARRLLWSIRRFQAVIGSLRRGGQRHVDVVTLFVSIEDPMSFTLLRLCIKKLKELYKITFDIRVIKIGVYSYDISHLDKQQEWLLKDSKVFAYLYSDSGSYSLNSPTVSSSYLRGKFRLEVITNDLVALGQLLGTSSDAYLNTLEVIFRDLWVRGEYNYKHDEYPDYVKYHDVGTESILQQNMALLSSAGYFGPGVLDYQGEIYTLSRVHHLERRLLDRGLRRLPKALAAVYFDREFERELRIGSSSSSSSSSHDRCSDSSSRSSSISSSSISNYKSSRFQFSNNYSLCEFLRGIYAIKKLKNVSSPPSLSPSSSCSACIKLFYSFRSPYSQIVLKRLKGLVSQYCNSSGKGKIRLEIKVLMPMVMRGLPVSYEKTKYIATDCAREARLRKLKFGCLCDPVHPDGLPVKRALRGFLAARSMEREVEYLESFASNVWGEGVDAGTDRGLRQIVKDAGIPWSLLDANDQLDSESEKETARNREELLSYGLWGVPCILYEPGDGEDRIIVWGQDKFWVIEELVIQRFSKENKPISD